MNLVNYELIAIIMNYELIIMNYELSQAQSYGLFLIIVNITTIFFK